MKSQDGSKRTKKKILLKPVVPALPVSVPHLTTQALTSAVPVPTLQKADELDHTNNILNNAMKQYKDVVHREETEFRADIGSLQHIVTEFLTDFIIVGHTMNDQRVVVRYAKSPKDLDGLMQLAKKVLIRMVVEEESSD